MFALLLAAGVALAARNSIPFTITLTDQSPLLSFYPSDDAELPGLWQTSFGGGSVGDRVQPGTGASMHYYNTSAQPATDASGQRRPVGIQLKAEASEIVVWGDKDGSPPPNGTITVQMSGSTEAAGTGMDNETTTVPSADGVKLAPGQLARLTNLPADEMFYYDFMINDTAPGVYNVRKVDVSTALVSDAFDEVSVSVVPFAVGGGTNLAFKHEGQWTVDTTEIYVDSTSIYHYQSPFSVVELVSNSDGTSVSIDVPEHTSYILINGTVGPGTFSPSFHWTPAPPGLATADIDAYNASMPWISGQTLYMQRLDPDTRYTLQMRGSAAGYVRLHTATFYSANPTSKDDISTSSKTSTGTIVGAVIGSVVGAAIIAALAFYFCFWRPRKRRDREEEAALSRDNAGFVPFGQDTNSSAQQSIVQETDAGTATLPPEYNPQWSGPEMRTAGAPSPVTTDRAGTVAQTSGPNSAATGSAISSLAPWKVPYVTGAYADSQETPPMSAVSQVADYKLPFINGAAASTSAGLPSGAAPAQLSPEASEGSAQSSMQSSMRRLGSTEKLVPVRPSESRPLPEPPR